MTCPRNDGDCLQSTNLHVTYFVSHFSCMKLILEHGLSSGRSKASVMGISTTATKEWRLSHVCRKFITVNQKCFRTMWTALLNIWESATLYRSWTMVPLNYWGYQQRGSKFMKTWNWAAQYYVERVYALLESTYQQMSRSSIEEDITQKVGYFIRVNFLRVQSLCHY